MFNKKGKRNPAYTKEAEAVIKEIRATIERGRLDGRELETVQNFWLKHTESTCLLAGLAKVAATGSAIEQVTAALQKQIDSLRRDANRADENNGTAIVKGNANAEEIGKLKKRLTALEEWASK